MSHCFIVSSTSINSTNIILFLLYLFSSYEPELFPGLIYRMVKPRIVLLIFVSGKVVLTGENHIMFTSVCMAICFSMANIDSFQEKSTVLQVSPYAKSETSSNLQ